MTTGKTIALIRWTFVGKVMSLLFNMLSRLVITFLPRSKCLLISRVKSPSAVILEPPKIKSVAISIASPVRSIMFFFSFYVSVVSVIISTLSLFILRQRPLFFLVISAKKFINFIFFKKQLLVLLIFLSLFLLISSHLYYLLPSAVFGLCLFFFFKSFFFSFTFQNLQIKSEILKKNLFIYLWLCWVFIAVRGFSLLAVSGG